MFVPAALLCLLPSEMADWGVVGAAFAVSAAFLGRNLWPFLRGSLLPTADPDSSVQTPSASRKRALLITGSLIACHGALAVLLKLFFFRF